MFTRILIVADLEGSTGCYDYNASRLLTREWASSIIDMSLDLDHVVRALFEAGVEKIIVNDFHRTSYNLLPGLIDKRAVLRQGYVSGPIPGIGSPEDTETVMFLGMHAPSGSPGFLPHTLTSRIARLEVNDFLLSEAQMLASLLSPYGIAPVFFSGCSEACKDITSKLKNIVTVTIDKKHDSPCDTRSLRLTLAESAVKAINNIHAAPYVIDGPLSARVTMRDGEKAARLIADRWNLSHHEATLYLETPDMESLYSILVKICYLTPCIERHIGPALAVYNAYGWCALHVARHIVRPWK